MTFIRSSRGRFKINLWVVIVVVAIFAVATAGQVNRARRQREAVEAVKAYGGWVHYDYEFVNGKLKPGREPSAPAWLRSHLGDEYFQDVVYVNLRDNESSGRLRPNGNSDDAAAVLAKTNEFPNLSVLMLRGTQATDEGLRHIGELTRLEELYIFNAAAVSDAGVTHLARLRNLKKVQIDHARITDVGLRVLCGLHKLEDMWLQGNGFTDAGITELKRLGNVKKLCLGLGTTRISDKGLESVKHLKNLELLDLQGSVVTDNGLRHLSGLSKLNELWTSGSIITEKGKSMLRMKLPVLIIQ